MGDARFADAWFARDQHHLPVAALSLLPPANEEVDLLLASNQRRHSRPRRFEPALDRAGAQHLPRRYVLSEALECDGAEIAIFEQAANQLPGTRRNYHRAWLRQRMETC